MKAAVGRCCDYRAKRRPATLAALVIAAAIALSPPVLADPTADPGDVQTLTPPPSLASTPALDEQFLADLTNAGMRIADVPVAIAGAHDTCAFIAARHTAAEAMQTGMANNPTMTRADETAYVQAAIAVFCPRFLGMTDTLA
jgi:hypothetical protein